MKSLTESILSSNKANLRSIIYDIIHANQSEKNLKQLQRIWASCGLDLPGGKWIEAHKANAFSYGYYLVSDSGRLNTMIIVGDDKKSPHDKYDIDLYSLDGAMHYSSILGDLKITSKRYEEWTKKVIKFFNPSEIKSSSSHYGLTI